MSRTCCRGAWLLQGWLCRYCGRDAEIGPEEAARGIFGGRSHDWNDMPSFCECGWELRGWTNFNYSSCGSCYWVLTMQLVRRLLQDFGPWSQIHDNIFECLLEPPCYGVRPAEAASERAKDLESVRLYGQLVEGGPGDTTAMSSRDALAPSR